jgi:Haem-NO-binding
VSELPKRPICSGQEAEVMYGLVNRAIEQMVCQGHGEETWEKIKLAAGVDVDVFIGNEGYDDAITYQLVGAASAILEVPADQILEGFGRHWILRTAKEGYGYLLDAAGHNLPTFLCNLPTFHTRVKLLYPDLRPPLFECDEVAATSLRFHYRSSRDGLAPFVRGLLLGLGELFKISVTVQQLAAKAEGDDHDIFRVNWVEHP